MQTEHPEAAVLPASQDPHESCPIKRIVIWGLLRKYHTHRHIHQSFYKNARKLGYDVIWVEDEKESQKFIRPGDLIIAAEVGGRMIPEKRVFADYNLPVRGDVYYCLHNYKATFEDTIRDLYPERLVRLRVYETPSVAGAGQQWGPVTYFDSKTRTLYQPWGTDLLPHEFKKPVFRKNKTVFWIGSIWNDKENRGNIGQIGELKAALAKRSLRFAHVRFIPDFLNIFLVRLSRIAPAIAGRYQTQVNYLPCRVFKNISYGQLGITNVPKFKDILGDSFVQGETIDELVQNALSLSEAEYKSKTAAQQEIVKEYTYKKALQNIYKAFGQQGK